VSLGRSDPGMDDSLEQFENLHYCFLSFILPDMWPFALLSLLVIPFMGFATALEMKTFLGVDEGAEVVEDGCDSPGGIIVETLLNIRTVSALTLEEQRLKDYEKALAKVDGNTMKESAVSGSLSGLSIGIQQVRREILGDVPLRGYLTLVSSKFILHTLVQQWVNALQFWWGAWLMYNYPGAFTFNEFLVSMFALLFSLFSLGAAAQGLTDKKKAEAAAGRLFYIMNRESAIDPLSPLGKKLS
jgi:ATP-binding cassette subfamily B (MDR/TAP) protein 1